MTTPIVNTHVHVPPNFSAFTSPEDVVSTARAEGARAIGISNFYDQHVYGRFAELCRAAGIVPLFGLEFITLVPDLAAAGIRVNDPANPGRMYVCGKGIDPFREKSPEATATAAEIREGNDSRAAEMVKPMAANPIILAMANPDPEILPEDAKAVRPDVIIGTGRSDGARLATTRAIDACASTITSSSRASSFNAAATSGIRIS